MTSQALAKAACRIGGVLLLAVGAGQAVRSVLSMTGGVASGAVASGVTALFGAGVAGLGIGLLLLVAWVVELSVAVAAVAGVGFLAVAFGAPSRSLAEWCVAAGVLLLTWAFVVRSLSERLSPKRRPQ